MDKILISVVIPTYNRAHVLERSINSVLEQSYSDIELIVVDDGSSDNTDAIMQKYSNDERVRYHKLDKNAGVSNARNVGASLCRGEWIAFQDSDDAWHKDKLEKQLDYVAKHKECGMVYSAYAHYMNGVDGYTRMPKVAPKGSLTDYLLVQNCIGAVTVLIRKELFQKLEGYNCNYPSLEDWEFAIRASMATSVGYIDECLVDAYYSEGGVGEKSENYLKARCMLIADYRGELEKRGIFDSVVMDLFNLVAEYDGKLVEQVKKILMIELLERMEKG